MLVPLTPTLFKGQLCMENAWKSVRHIVNTIKVVAIVISVFKYGICVFVLFLKASLFKRETVLAKGREMSEVRKRSLIVRNTQVAMTKQPGSGISHYVNHQGELN